jgi:aspartate aminotransferase
VQDETALTAPRLARGVQGLGTESAFAVLARARELERQGRSVVHLEIGQPDFPTPEHVIEAATASMRRGETGYTPSAGIAEFREVAANELARSREIDVAPDRVLVANGAKLLLFLTILAVCDPADEVIYPDPGFPIYESAIRWAGAVPVPLALHDELDFRFSLDELSGRLGKRTKLVIVNSPNNPTGGIVPADELRATAELIRESPAWVLSDVSCVPAFVQAAGIAALTGPQDCVAAMVEEFRQRRELVVAGLNQLPGIQCRAPQGAFYAFPDVSHVPIPSQELADRLLDEAGVALLAGDGFGAQGEQHLRISYANSRAQIELGLDRMREFLAGQDIES